MYRKVSFIVKCSFICQDLFFKWANPCIFFVYLCSLSNINCVQMMSYLKFFSNENRTNHTFRSVFCTKWSFCVLCDISSLFYIFRQFAPHEHHSTVYQQKVLVVLNRFLPRSCPLILKKAKRKYSILDSNPGPQDGSCRLILWARCGGYPLI